MEQILPFNPAKTYPVCMAGARKTPPEGCGGPQGFMENEVKLELALRDKKFRMAEIMAKLMPTFMDETSSIKAAVEPYRAELSSILQVIEEAKFNRFFLNQRLKLHVSGDVDWRWKELEKKKPKKKIKSQTQSVKTKKANK